MYLAPNVCDAGRDMATQSGKLNSCVALNRVVNSHIETSLLEAKAHSARSRQRIDSKMVAFRCRSYNTYLAAWEGGSLKLWRCVGVSKHETDRPRFPTRTRDARGSPSRKSALSIIACFREVL